MYHKSTNNSICLSMGNNFQLNVCKFLFFESVPGNSLLVTFVYYWAKIFFFKSYLSPGNFVKPKVFINVNVNVVFFYFTNNIEVYKYELSITVFKVHEPMIAICLMFSDKLYTFCMISNWEPPQCLFYATLKITCIQT